jgi:hypothetical protein
VLARTASTISIPQRRIHPATALVGIVPSLSVTLRLSLVDGPAFLRGSALDRGMRKNTRDGRARQGNQDSPLIVAFRFLTLKTCLRVLFDPSRSALAPSTTEFVG